jgi:hypothetical protein
VIKTLVEAKRPSNPLLKSKIINYVLTRQNQDGGYCFAQGAIESRGQDKFYGLAIFKKLNASPGPIYHVNKYEKATRILKEALADLFTRADFQEIPYGSIEDNGFSIKLNVTRGTWESSFGHGSVEGTSGKTGCSAVLLLHAGH